MMKSIIFVVQVKLCHFGLLANPKQDLGPNSPDIVHVIGGSVKELRWARCLASRKSLQSGGHLQKGVVAMAWKLK